MTQYSPLKFLFKIDLIQPDYDKQVEQRAGDLNWRPPTIPEAILTLDSTGWRRWKHDGITNATGVVSEDFRVCSLFYNSESNQFLGVPVDCRGTNIRELVNTKGDQFGWRRVMFNYEDAEANRPPLSIMDFDLEHHVLASAGSRTWMPELIPDTYNQNQPEDAVNAPTGLAGNLSLLVAFAAFSCDWPNLFTTVFRHCFKPPYWQPHGHHISGRVHSRGLVVTIRVDPEPPTVTGAVLKNFEKGVYGAIIQP